MSRIGEAETRADRRQSSSRAGGAEEVDEVYRAITARMEGEPVDAKMGPMMSDLLTRLESLSGGREPTQLNPPEPPDTVAPPSPAEELHLLRTAQSSLEEVAGQIGRTDRGEAVRGLLQTVQEYRLLKEDVLMRAEFAREGR